MNTNLATNNIVGFPNQPIETKINDFLNGYDSDNTKRNYRKYFKDMFMYMCGKDMNDIMEDDLKSITISRVKEYRTFLKDKCKYKSNHVNQRIFACKKLWKYLIEEELVSANSFELDKIKVRKEVHYGSLTAEEIEQLYEYCLSLKDRGITKKLYFEFLATVTCRKSAAQGLTWNNIKRKLNREDGQHYWVVDDTYDKTDFVDTAISEDFYQRLKDNFESYSDKDQEKGLIFNVENQTLRKTLIDFCDTYEIDRIGRNITQHSIKSSGLDLIYDVFGDIKMVAKAGHHKNIQTPYNNYIGKNNDYSNQASILLSKNYDFQMLEGLSKEELLNVIKGCGKTTMIKLCRKAEEKGLITIE